VLVHNVTKESDNADARLEIDSDFSMDEEEEDNLTVAAVVDDAEAPRQDWASVLTTHRPKNNTGGKGVLADYQEATRVQRRRNETERLKRVEAVRAAGGKSTSEHSISLAAAAARNHKGDNDDQDDDDDGNIVQKFRAQRMQQYASVAGLPQYGKVLAVGKFAFVDTVNMCDPRTSVVVHVYEEYLASCRRMNEFLDVLAVQYPHVLFLKLQATDADQTLSHSVLPAFLVYRGGNRVSDASVNAEFEDKFTKDDVEYLLASKYRVPLPGVDVSKKETSAFDAPQQARPTGHGGGDQD